MSEIIYKRGNILSASEFIIAHGCNAQGVMGSGAARGIKTKWPDAYRVYKDHYNSRAGLFPGQVVWAPVEEKIIANCITQDRYGRDNEQYTEYKAIRECMQEINKFEHRELGLAMPLIGAGLGGGDWEIIKDIIQQEIQHVNPVVYILPSEWDNFMRVVD